MLPVSFDALFQNGRSPAALVELSLQGKVSWRFTNENRDIEWGGQTYKSVPMKWQPPSSKDGIPSGGTLEIDADIQNDSGYELLAWFDEAADEAEMKAVAVISGGGIIPIGRLRHRNGTVAWDGRKITWRPEWDDRLQMQVNPVNFDSEALSGF